MHNIERIRADFPTLTKGPFFASAGVGPLPSATLTAMRTYAEALRADFFVGAWEEDPKKEARSLAAGLINASEEEVALTDSTSTGINILAGGLPWKPGDNIVLNDLEYPANVFPWLHQAERYGVEVRVVPSRSRMVPLDDLVAAVDRRTRVLAVSHVEFGCGYRNDIAALTEAVHRVDGLICVDAIQSLGVLQVDVKDLGVDVLATGGYKWLCGPLGTGFAYVQADLMETLRSPTMAYANLPQKVEENVWNSLLSGANYPMEYSPLADDCKRFESEGLSPVLFKGLATSLRYLLDLGIDRIESRIAELVEYLIGSLNAEGIEILSPTHQEGRSGIVTVVVPFDLGQSAQVKELEERVQAAGIKALPRGGGLRLAVHFFNTSEEIDRVVGFIKAL